MNNYIDDTSELLDSLNIPTKTKLGAKFTFFGRIFVLAERLRNAETYLTSVGIYCTCITNDNSQKGNPTTHSVSCPCYKEK